MKQRLFEDDQMYDVQRQTTGMGSEIANQGPITVAGPSNHRNKDSEIEKNKLFPIDAIEQTISNVFIGVTNTQKLLDRAKANPVIDSNKVEDLENKLKEIAKLVVDFDDLLSKINK